MKNSTEVDKLPKIFKKNWLKALRSEKYVQGDGALRTANNKYCCLGVAAHMVGCKSITNKGFILKGNNIEGISKVPEMLIGDSNKIVSTLSEMNDCGKSFKTIAKFIETNY